MQSAARSNREYLEGGLTLSRFDAITLERQYLFTFYDFFKIRERILKLFITLFEWLDFFI